MTTSDLHIPVMLDRTLELLAPALDIEDAVLIDATLGLGGHAAAALERHPGLTLVGLDRELTVIGAGDRAEIWSTEAWNSYYSEREEAFANTEEEVIPGLF